MRQSARHTTTTVSKVILWGITALILAVVGGYVVWAVTTYGAPRRQVASQLSDLEDLCGGRHIPQAPAYVPGSGAHPMAVFENNRDGVVRNSGGQASLSGFEKVPALFNPSDAGSVQLVACTERTEDGPVVARCTYRDSAGDMHRSTLKITVYEARTGKQVREPITMVGEDTACPTWVFYKSKEPVLFSAPSPSQFITTLTPFTQP